MEPIIIMKVPQFLRFYRNVKGVSMACLRSSVQFLDCWEERNPCELLNSLKKTTKARNDSLSGVLDRTS